MLSAMASEEQKFRDELERDQSETSLSYNKYQSELEKLLNPEPVRTFALRYILFPLGVIALALVIFFFVKQIRLNIISEVKDKDVVEVDVDQVRTEKAALAHADSAETSSDFRGALRYLYLSAIFHLQERGILPYDKSMTNREYLRQSEVDNDLFESLHPAIRVFDEVWYGHKPCNAKTVSDYRDLLKNVHTNS